MLEYGKQGYLRTLEAVIAIVLVLLFIYTVTPKASEEKAGIPSNVESAQRFIFQNLSFSDSVRNCLMASDIPSSDCNRQIDEVINKNVPVGYEYTFIVCSQTSCTTETPFEKDVYMSDIFIASSLSQQKPKIIRLYIWEK